MRIFHSPKGQDPYRHQNGVITAFLQGEFAIYCQSACTNRRLSVMCRTRYWSLSSKYVCAFDRKHYIKNWHQSQYGLSV